MKCIEWPPTGIWIQKTLTTEPVTAGWQAEVDDLGPRTGRAWAIRHLTMTHVVAAVVGEDAVAYLKTSEIEVPIEESEITGDRRKHYLVKPTGPVYIKHLDTLRLVSPLFAGEQAVEILGFAVEAGTDTDLSAFL